MARRRRCRLPKTGSAAVLLAPPRSLRPLPPHLLRSLLLPLPRSARLSAPRSAHRARPLVDLRSGLRSARPSAPTPASAAFKELFS